jgi:hypothetical protein
MATAFNPSSVISDISVEAPDFSLLTKAAASVQGRYLEGFNKYKSTITSLLNANITSDDNKKFRSEYFKKIDDYLNNLSGIDFSNPANASVANTLMDPLVKDKEFVTDLNFSTMQAAERSKLDQVRSSTDEKVFSQYSPTMEAAMSYAEQDMKNAKRGNGSIFKVSPQKFVPFANIQNNLNDAAHKMGLQMKFDYLTGAYIITDKNGKQAIPNFTDWARQQLGDTYDQQLLVMGKVKMRQQVDSLMQSDPNLTKEQAFQQVAKDNSLAIYSNHNDYKQGLDSGVANIDIELKKIKNKYKNYIPKGSEDEQLYNQLTQLKGKYQKELSDLNANQADKDKELQNSFQQFMNNPEYALLPSMKDSLAKGWAQTYAMSNVEHSIQVNQKVLQDENHAWQKHMADYNYMLDLNKKKIDYAIDVDKKRIDFDYFKKQKDYEAGIAKDKSIFDAQLDFEKALAGLSGSKDGSGGGGGIPGLNKLTKGVMELQESDVSDAYKVFQEQKANAMNTVLSNYLDETVLQAATHDSKYVHPDATSSLMNVMQNFGKYGNPSNKNFANAPKEYQQDYNSAIQFLKLINGNVKSINSTADIPNLIFNGARTYTGDALKWKKANDMLSTGAKAFNEYTDLKKKEEAQLKTAIAQGYGTDKYWEVDEDGQPRPKTEVTGFWHDVFSLSNHEFTEEDKNAFYKAITPNYDAYQKRTQERTNSVDYVADPKNFNFNAIGELIGKSYKIQGMGGDDGLVSTGEKDSKLNTFINQYKNAGAQLGEYFVPNFHISKLQNGDLKVEVPFVLDKDNSVKLSDVNSDAKTATFYVDKANAAELWKNIGNTSFMGKNYNYNLYGDLSKAYSYFNQASEPVSWIVDGFSNNQTKVALPKYLLVNGVDDGYITFDKVKDELYAVLEMNNQKSSYGTGITRAQYVSNPAGISNTINEIVENAITKLQSANLAKREQDQQKLSLDVLKNPNNFTKVSE